VSQIKKIHNIRPAGMQSLARWGNSGFDAQPLFAHPSHNVSFEKQLKYFFIRNKYYLITDKALCLPEMQGIPKAEKTEHERQVALAIEQMLQNGKRNYLLDSGAIVPRAPMGYWNDSENRKFWVRALVDYLKKDPRSITQRDFVNNGLGTMLENHFSGSPIKAIAEAFPELKISQGEIDRRSRGFYGKKKERMAATRKLIEPDFTNGDMAIYRKLKSSPELLIWAEWMEIRRLREEGKIPPKQKDPRDLTRHDFERAGLSGMLQFYFHGSTFKAVSEAFPELRIRGWEMIKTPRGFFAKKKNRVAAVKWLCEERLHKDPSELLNDDFTGNRLTGLIEYYGSVHRAVSEAYPEKKIRPWMMLFVPNGYYRTMENRVTALLEYAQSIGKDPISLSTVFLKETPVASLLRWPKDRPDMAVIRIRQKAHELYLRAA